MNILLVLIPISMILLGIAVWALVWAVRKGQFDDLDTPALAILADDDLHQTKPQPKQGAASTPASPQPERNVDHAGGD